MAERRLLALLRALTEAHVDFLCGPLDLPGTIGRGRGYEALLPHSVEMEVGDGVRIRVLDLETVIAVKEEVGGEKDLATLAILKRTLREKQDRGRDECRAIRVDWRGSGDLT